MAVQVKQAHHWSMVSCFSYCISPNVICYFLEKNILKTEYHINTSHHFQPCLLKYIQIIKHHIKQISMVGTYTDFYYTFYSCLLTYNGIFSNSWIVWKCSCHITWSYHKDPHAILTWCRYSMCFWEPTGVFIICNLLIFIS